MLRTTQGEVTNAIAKWIAAGKIIRKLPDELVFRKNYVNQQSFFLTGRVPTGSRYSDELIWDLANDLETIE